MDKDSQEQETNEEVIEQEPSTEGEVIMEETLEVPPVENEEDLDFQQELMRDYEEAAKRAEEEPVKEPENVEIPETAPEETQEEQTEPEVEKPEEAPAEPSEEVQEADPNLPEYTKFVEGDIDLTSQEEVDAINAWAGGPRAPWVRQTVDQMTPEQQVIYKKHQRGFEKHRHETVVKPQEEARATQPTAVDASQAALDFAEILKGNQDVINRYKNINLPQDSQATPQVPPKTPDTKLDPSKFEAIKTAFEENDPEKFATALTGIVAEVTDKATQKATFEAKKGASETYRNEQEERQFKQTENRVRDEAAEIYKQEGIAFSRYIEDGSIEWFMENGFLGKPIETVQKAYDLCKKVFTGVEPVVEVRQKPNPDATLPPRGTGGGAEPLVTDKDMEKPLVDFMYEAAEKVGYK